MKATLLYLLLMFCCVTSSFSQQFVGVNSSAYAGLYAINHNPANIVDSKFKFELQFVSATAPLNGLYFGDDIEFTDEFENSITENINAMARAMSFAFQFGKRKHSISLTFEGRGNASASNFDSNLASILLNNTSIEEIEDTNIRSNDLQYQSNIWTETGLSYGLVILNQGAHYLKGSGRIKLIHSINSTNINSQNIEISGNNNRNLNINISDTNFTFYNIEDSSNFNFSKFNTSFDFGVVYNWRPNKHYADEEAKYNYKLSLGIALVDIGNFTSSNQIGTRFSGSLNTDENFQATVDDIDSNESITDFLISNSDIMNTDEERTYELPRRLILQADYQVYKGVFVHALLDTGNTNEEQFQIQSSSFFQITPRIESQKLGLYVPLTFDDGFHFGLGARLGPLAIGVQDFSALLANPNEFNNNLVSIGLRVAIKKSKNEESK